MIGSYLHSLFFNCKLLAKPADFDLLAVETYFTDEIKSYISENGFKDEPNLISRLMTASYPEVLHLIEKSNLMYIFYLVNSLSEYKTSPASLDELGRYKFSGSLQKQTGITENTVLELIKKTVASSRILSTNFKISHHPSYFYLSHDIDSLYGSLLQDGLWALKNKRFDVMLKLFLNVLTVRPHWFNIDLIMDLESEYDFRSTFYWLVNKGKIDQRQTNSDYSIQSPKLIKTLEKVKSRGFENGIHKSISKDTFKTELSKLPHSVEGNRFHYLKYQLPAIYHTIQESGLKVDASLGFAENFGFRNSYGYPFAPYNFDTGAAFSFIEVPLTLMDGTFQRYMKLPVDKTAECVISFIEKNKQDCLLSVLWHNTFFTDYKYKGYKEEYIKILQYFHEEKLTNINQNGISELFTWKN